MVVTLAMIRAAQRAYTHSSGNSLDTYTVQAMLLAAYDAERIRLVETGLTRADPEELEED